MHPLRVLFSSPWLGGLVVATVGLMCYVVWVQQFFWGHVEEYSFGYLVPLFIGYVLFERWPQIREGLVGQAEVEGAAGKAAWADAIALAGLIASAFGIVAGALYRAAAGPENLAAMLVSFGLAGFILCIVFLGAGQLPVGEAGLNKRLRYTALFLFPALIWMISAPLAPAFEQTIRVFLLTKVAVVVTFIFDMLSIPISREGGVLILPNGRVGVEDACSGIRSLTGCLFAGSFLAAVFLDKAWKKVLLLATAICMAVLMNFARSFFLTYWVYLYGDGSIDEPALWGVSVHDLAGYAVLGVTCVALLALLPLFQLSAEPSRKAVQ